MTNRNEATLPAARRTKACHIYMEEERHTKQQLPTGSSSLTRESKMHNATGCNKRLKTVRPSPPRPAIALRQPTTTPDFRFRFHVLFRRFAPLLAG